MRIPRSKRAYSGTKSPQQNQQTPVPPDMVRVGIVLPVGCNLADMDWYPYEPTPQVKPEHESVIEAFRAGLQAVSRG